MNEALTTEIEKLAQRVTLIEEALNYLLEEKEAQMPPEAVKPAARATTSMPVASNISPSLRHPAVPSKNFNWMGSTAVICFVLAGAFIIKLSIDSGWLTPARQIGIAAILGFALIASGLRLVRFDDSYAGFLPAAGIIILYLDALSAHAFYGLITANQTLALVAVISGVSIWLFTVLENEIYALTAAVGSYAAPFLLGGQSQADFILYYQMICTVAFAFISIWLDTRFLAIVASYLAIITTSLLSHQLLNLPALCLAMAFHFTAFAIATVIHTVLRREPLTENEAWAYFPVLIIFYSCEYDLLHRLNPTLAPWISLVFAVFLIAMYFVTRRTMTSRSLESSSLIAAFASVILFHSLYLEILTDDIRPWLLPAILLAAAFYRSTPHKKNSIPLLALAAVVACEYVHVFFRLIGNSQNPVFASVAFMSAGAAFLFFVKRKTELTNKNASDILLVGAHGLAVSALYNLMNPFGSLMVSASWLVYAVLIVTAGFLLRDQRVAKSSVMILGLAAGKALLYDASAAETPIRIACLLLTGAVLYACGLLLRRIESWNPQSS